MLNVSSAMEQYINSPVRDDRQYLRVEVSDTRDGAALFSLNLSEMVSGSLSFSRRSVSSSNFDIGQSYIDEGRFTVDREALEDTYASSLTGKYCRFIYGVSDINDGEDEEIQIFVGIVPQGGITKKRTTIEITLDSVLSLLYTNVQEITSGTPFVLINHISTKTGIPMSARLTSYVNSHVNNQYTYFIADDSSIATYLDLIMWLSQILGGAITCNNLGELDIVVYDRTVTPYTLHSGICKSSSVSEDTIYFNSCSIVIDNVETKVVGTATDTLTLQLADNPLLTGIQDEILRNIIIQNIYNQMATVPLRGFTYEYNGNPLIELGDYIQYSGVNTFVEVIEYGFRKTSKLEGYTIDNRLTTTSQSIKSAAHSGGGGGSVSTETVGILKYVLASNKSIFTAKRTVIAEEYMALYANTRAFLSTTIVFDMFTDVLDTTGTLVILQYFDNVALPMIIKQSIRGDEQYHTVSFNTVVPESDIYETHQYRLEAYVIDNSGVLDNNTKVGNIEAYNLETNIVGFMAAGGQPTFTGAYFCEDTVPLNTSIANVNTSDIGTIEDTANVTI